MAEFCLECFKKFESDANDYNTSLSEQPDFCEGCFSFKPVVIEFYDWKDDKK